MREIMNFMNVFLNPKLKEVIKGAIPNIEREEDKLTLE